MPLREGTQVRSVGGRFKQKSGVVIDYFDDEDKYYVRFGNKKGLVAAVDLEKEEDLEEDSRRNGRRTTNTRSDDYDDDRDRRSRRRRDYDYSDESDDDYRQKRRGGDKILVREWVRDDGVDYGDSSRSRRRRKRPSSARDRSFTPEARGERRRSKRYDSGDDYSSDDRDSRPRESRRNNRSSPDKRPPRKRHDQEHDDYGEEEEQRLQYGGGRRQKRTPKKKAPKKRTPKKKKDFIPFSRWRVVFRDGAVVRTDIDLESKRVRTIPCQQVLQQTGPAVKYNGIQRIPVKGGYVSSHGMDKSKKDQSKWVTSGEPILRNISNIQVADLVQVYLEDGKHAGTYIDVEVVELSEDLGLADIKVSDGEVARDLGWVDYVFKGEPTGTFRLKKRPDSDKEDAPPPEDGDQEFYRPPAPRGRGGRGRGRGPRGRGRGRGPRGGGRGRGRGREPDYDDDGDYERGGDQPPPRGRGGRGGFRGNRGNRGRGRGGRGFGIPFRGRGGGRGRGRGFDGGPPPNFDGPQADEMLQKFKSTHPRAREGDWDCPGCGFFNYRRNGVQCKNCGMDVSRADSGRGGRGRGGDRGNRRGRGRGGRDINIYERRRYFDDSHYPDRRDNQDRFKWKAPEEETEVETLVRKRAKARSNGDYDAADEIQRELRNEFDVYVKDQRFFGGEWENPDGTRGVFPGFPNPNRGRGRGRGQRGPRGRGARGRGGGRGRGRGQDARNEQVADDDQGQDDDDNEDQDNETAPPPPEVGQDDDNAEEEDVPPPPPVATRGARGGGRGRGRGSRGGGRGRQARPGTPPMDDQDDDYPDGDGVDNGWGDKPDNQDDNDELLFKED